MSRHTHIHSRQMYQHRPHKAGRCKRRPQGDCRLFQRVLHKC